MNKREAKTNQLMGQRLRERRILKGLSLMRVAALIGYVIVPGLITHCTLAFDIAFRIASNP